MTSVKICGITNQRDLESCIKSNVSWVGFNFWPGSKRYIQPAEAAAMWRSLASSGSTRAAAVFVDPSDEAVAAALADFPELEALQLHGEETVAGLGKLRSTKGERQIWKAIRVASPEDVERGRSYAEVADLVLFDGRDPGSGQGFDWHWLPDGDFPLAYGIAGGLRADNVGGLPRNGIALIDACSGVESVPGQKDDAKLAAFLRAIRVE